jgi:streptogramin lyase
MPFTRVLILSLFAVAACAALAGATPLGTITQFPAPGTNIAQVRAGSDGNLWFTDRAGAIGRITTEGVISRFTTGLNPGSQPFSIAMGADGNMWFTDAPAAAGVTGAIGMIDPGTHAIAEFSTGLNSGSKPAGIALGPDGNLWFTDNNPGTPAIGVINPTTHAILEFSSGLNAGSLPPQGITAGPDGNMWFTDRGTTKAIGMINPTSHAIVEFSSGLNLGSVPGPSIAVGPDGNLWFIDNGSTQAIGTINPTSHAIVEFATGPGTSLGRLAVGPDGNIWFADKGSAPAIATIDPTTHAITRYASGFAAGSGPSGINTGADGNVWFTDQGATFRGMGRVGTGAPPSSATAPAIIGTGGVNVAQTCGGDTWASWAGQQPSRSAFDFDGYRWLLDGNPIAGASGTSYTPTADQAGHALSCKVTATYGLVQVTVSATSTEVTVEGAAEQSSQLANAVVGIGPGASLAHKASAIQDDVAANSTSGACEGLVAFGNEVRAQSGKKLSTTQATSLLARAKGIEAALGC